jgi:hypothetical protein
MSEPEFEIIPRANSELIAESGVATLLEQIRPHWKAKNLIQRVFRLVRIDPSSACQRIFNAATHDLKEKIVMAGLDIAQEAAKQNKFPEVSKAEHVDALDVKRTINLSYHMGLLTRPEWRRLLRVYDIRRDLEHEDDEYEATVEDCVYTFKTCIDVVLSRDPVQLLKLNDIRELVEKPTPVSVTQSTLDDYSQAPVPRQTEILRFLISNALDSKHPDIIRQNAYNVIGSLRSLTNNQVIISCAEEFIERVGRQGPDLLHARVAYQAGIFPYLKRAQLKEFFNAYSARLRQVGYGFRNHESHGDILRSLQEVGGIAHCPDDSLPAILEWLVLCYIGEPGGYGYFGSSRKVFYSNTGAPICLSLIRDAGRDLSQTLERFRTSSDAIKHFIANEHVLRRFEDTIDLFNT